MALRLRVTGQMAARLGEHATRVFGVHGGRIGRAADNDWPIPDPERYLSGHHAAIEYRGGTWYVVDTSSNGTYLNDGTFPIGRDHSHAVKSGDRVRMGEYTFIVSVSPDNDFPPDVEAVAALDPMGDADFALATHGDLGAELDVKRLISDPNPPPDGPAPRAGDALRLSDAYGQTVAVPPPRPAPEVRTSRPAVQAVPPPRRDSAGGMSAAIHALCRGAGLDPSTISPEHATAVMTLAGQLVREFAIGLMSGLQQRTEQAGRFQIEETSITSGEQNAFRMSVSVDEVLARLFAPRSSRYLTPLEAVRRSFSDLHRHEQATVIAMQDALAEYLKRLAPEQLELQFGETLARAGATPALPGQKYWEMYGDFYRVLAQMSPEGLPHAFAEDYARAYATASDELREGTRRAPPATGSARAKG